MNKETKARTEAGAGWLNQDGSISLVINPMVILRESSQHVIRLFPVDETSSAGKAKSAWNEKVKEAYEKGPLADEQF